MTAEAYGKLAWEHMAVSNKGHGFGAGSGSSCISRRGSGSGYGVGTDIYLTGRRVGPDPVIYPDAVPDPDTEWEQIGRA